MIPLSHDTSGPARSHNNSNSPFKQGDTIKPLSSGFVQRGCNIVEGCLSGAY